MNNIIEVEVSNIMEVSEHIRPKSEKITYRPKYTFNVELFFNDPKLPINTVLYDIDNKNTFRVEKECNGLYNCKTINRKKNNTIREPKRIIVLSSPTMKRDTIEKQCFDINSLEKQINGNSDMLCLVYDDSNKLYCDLLQREVSENYDIRIIVKKK